MNGLRVMYRRHLVRSRFVNGTKGNILGENSRKDGGVTFLCLEIERLLICTVGRGLMVRAAGFGNFL